MQLTDTTDLEVTETSKGEFKLTEQVYSVSSLLPKLTQYVVTLAEKELIVRQDEDTAREFYYGFLKGMEFFAKS